MGTWSFHHCPHRTSCGARCRILPNMDPDSLSQILAHGQRVAVGIAFLAGLTFSFNPVALAALPVSLAYVTRAREPRQALQYGTMFLLGMILTHAVLGAAAGAGGAGVATLIGRYWGLVLGPVLIILGLVWVGWVRLRLPALPLRARRASTLWGAFALRSEEHTSELQSRVDLVCR